MSKEKKKKWSTSTLILLITGLLLIAAALAMLVPTLLDYKKSYDTYGELNREYVQTVDEQDTEEAVNPNWWYEDVDVALEDVQAANSDIAGWIRFDHIEELSYPVLYSGDNETYLRTDIYGRSTMAGCIFIEGVNHPDFNDAHTIIYGHNMRNLSMFGSLKKYKTDDFYQENQYFTIYTNDMAYRYQIFAFRDIPETSAVYTVWYTPDDSFQTFINDMVSHSYEDTGIEVSKGDKVVTLSTCSTTGNRFVVHAVRIAEHEYQGR